MKSFFKFLLASILGVFIASIIMFFISMGIITALISSADKTVTIPSESLLHLKLNYPIPDRTPANPFENFDFVNMEPTIDMGLNDILKNIEKATKDEKIKGIYLDLTIIPAGLATIEEIRNALIEFKASGKFIIAYADYYVQNSYYLATVANKVYLNPKGIIPWTGMRAEVLFFKNTLEKLGLEPQIIRVGEYKSAVEPLIREDMSKENREQVNTFLTSIWDYMVFRISEQRGIPVDSLNYYADKLVIRSAQTAEEKGLVDGLKYKDEIIRELKDSMKVDYAKDLKVTTMKKYRHVPEIKDYKGLARDKIALVYATGDIMMGEGDDATVGAERISRAIRKARRDSSIKAIVFRVNSPGGSVLASDIIWREVKLAQQAKPVIASMGNLAASGGYYVVAPADTILASPVTLTGSIGVFGILLNAKEFMNDKLGITADIVKTNEHSDFPSLYRPLSQPERSFIKYSIEQSYEDFINYVAEGRGMSPDEVKDIAQGRVWSGVNAKDIQLIDMYGGLQAAIELAAEKTGLDNYRVVEYPKQEDPFEALLKEFTNQARGRFLKNEMGYYYDHYQQVKNLLRMDKVQARMPFSIVVE